MELYFIIGASMGSSKTDAKSKADTKIAGGGTGAKVVGGGTGSTAKIAGGGTGHKAEVVGGGTGSTDK